MRKMLVACETIEDEIKAALTRLGMESGWKGGHTSPELKPAPPAG
jgi:hypothetical protein